MASIRDLKKDLNYVLGDIIEAAYIVDASKQNKIGKESEAVIEDALKVFDALTVKINATKGVDKKAHFKQVRQELDTEARRLIDKINAL